MERRNVATVDIPGTFMQAVMEGDDGHMKMEGKMAEFLVKLDPKLYRKYITLEKGKSVLHVKLKKTLQVVMFFWTLLNITLQEWILK